jgi:hypothetical protein
MSSNRGIPHQYRKRYQKQFFYYMVRELTELRIPPSPAGKSLVTRDLAIRYGLENKFQLSPLEGRAVEIYLILALHDKFYTATALIAL